MRWLELPWQVKEILETLRAAGCEAYLVGGCVRDWLRGAAPHDWDLCTSALPARVEALCAGRFRAAHTGIAHGTLTLVAEGLPVEVTTFRADGPYPDHRRPAAVRLGATLAEDLARRDFTINAMAWAPGGEVIDPFEGRADLAAGTVRCVGRPDARFAEDALRILRAMRFAAQLDFAIDPATLAAARRQKGLLALVAPERVAAELDRLLCGPGAGRVLANCGDILAAAVPCPPAESCGGPRGEAWQRTAAAMEAAPPEPAVRWALLLQGPPGMQGAQAQAAGVLAHLRVKKRFAAEVLALLQELGRPLPADGPGVRRLLAKLGPRECELLAQAERAGLAALPAGGPGRQKELERFEGLLREQLARGACTKLEELAVGGKELIEAGLFVPGPALGCALRALLDAVLEGALPNEKSALLGWAAAHTKKF